MCRLFGCEMEAGAVSSLAVLSISAADKLDTWNLGSVKASLSFHSSLCHWTTD